MPSSLGFLSEGFWLGGSGRAMLYPRRACARSWVQPLEELTRARHDGHLVSVPTLTAHAALIMIPVTQMLRLNFLIALSVFSIALHEPYSLPFLRLSDPKMTVPESFQQELIVGIQVKLRI
jgi:hypothetical protein